MKHSILIIGFLLNISLLWGQTSIPEIPNEAFVTGEKLKYIIHYGFITGGTAELSVQEIDYKGQKVYYAVAKGKTVGITDNIYRVNDIYESYFDALTGMPIKAIRNISEDTYKYYNEVVFNHEKSYVLSQKSGKIDVPENILDILSAFYYARRTSFKDLKQGQIIKLDTYFADEVFPLEIRYKGKETIKTRFGKINCLKFSPVVEPGRIFDSEEDVTIYITNDNNYLPINIRVDLIIGAIEFELTDYRNLKNNFAVIK